MSSIPLPALHVQPPPPQEDPMQRYGQLLQLRNAMQNAPLQHQAMQQQVQSGALENQQRQQAMNDMQATTKAMQNWDGKDYNDILPLILKNGGSAQAVMGLKQKVLEQQQAIATTFKNNADGAKAQMEAVKTKGDLLDGALSSLSQVPDQQLPQALVQTAQDLAQKGVLDPQHAQQAAQLAQTAQPAQIRTQLDLMRKMNLAQSQILEDAQKKAATEKDTAQAGEATAQTNKLNQETQFGPTGPAAEAKYRFILQKKAAGQPLTADDVSFARGFEASNAKTSTTSDTLGVTSSNSSRPAGLASVGVAGNRAAAPTAVPGGGNAPAGAAGSPQVPSSAKESVVDLIGQYRYDPAQLSRLVAKHPDILSLVQQRFPDFDQTTYQAKSKLVQGYTSGPQSREINAYNTTMGHLSVLDDAVSALNNGNVRLLNSLANSVGAGTGNDAQTVFKAIVHRVGPEITGAYVAGGGGEGERATNEEDFNLNLGPQQLHTNIATSAKLLDSKVQALENQYKNSVGRDDFAQRFITPEAQAARGKLIGGNGGGKTTRYKIVNGELTPQ